MVTLLVAASGISVLWIGAAFRALLAELLVRWVTVRKVPGPPRAEAAARTR